MAADVAEILTRMLPDLSENWINLSYSMRRKEKGGLSEAKKILLVAQIKFPREWQINFNLACYCARLHQFDEATEWFKKAMTLNEKIVQKMGIDDPDLQPLWDSMSGTIWKRE